MLKKIGIIGTGLMGYAMAERLLDNYVDVSVFNRTTQRADQLSLRGAYVTNTHVAVMERSNGTILMLSDAQAIRDILFDAEKRAYVKGHTLIQMGTIAPEESIQIGAEIESLGGTYFEAPVLGSVPEVRAGELTIMVGSTEAQYALWSWVFDLLGKNIYHIGSVGKAAALKLALNQMIAALTIGFGTSLALVQQHGVDVDKFMDIVRSSALYAPTFDKKLQRMLTNTYDNPNFSVKNLLKDTRLFAAEAEKLGVHPASIQAACRLLEATMEAGLADQDYSALFNVISNRQSA
jgi:3-hydroxyisobutyrate dehydrogenase